MLHRRKDIEVSCRRVRGREHFVLKDPVRFVFHQLTPPEYFLWEHLDGVRTPEEICELYERQFVPQQLTPRDLQGFVEQLHRDELVVADALQQGDVLLGRRTKAAWAQWRRAMTNPLAIRLPGFHPRRVLRSLAPLAAIMFSPAAVAIGAFLIVISALLACFNFHEFQLRVLESTTVAGWPMIVLAICLLKILHELGHGLLCQTFGKECHEVGALLLVFSPALYCDVSDTWMLQSKWRRAAVAAVGIWVELVLAAAFGWLWWFSEPGWFHTFSFYVMTIGSLNSLLLNGNPLLRFDGYYVLSDLSEFPNLAERSRRAVGGIVRRWLFGIASPPTETRRDSRWLLIYGFISFLYKIMLVTAILWTCYHWLQPYRLESLVWVLFVLILANPTVQLALSLRKIMQHPEARKSGFRKRLVVVAAAMMACFLLLWIPLPREVAGRGDLRFKDERAIRVVVDGRLIKAVASGTVVRRGATLAQLENDTLRREVSDLLEQEVQLRGQIEEYQALRNTDPEIARKIPELEEQRAGLQAELTSRRQDLARLTLTAPRGGMVVPPPRRVRDEPADQLPTWDGTPLDPQNLGCYLEADTTLCRLGDPEHLALVVNVPAASIGSVALEQRVKIRFAAVNRTLHGRVASISQLNRRSQTELVNREETDDLLNHYAVVVELDEGDLGLAVGATGDVKIKVAPISIARRVQFWATRTFRLRL